MFVLCPHCQFLVAVDARSGLPPAQCPKCGGAIAAEAPAEAALAQPVPAPVEAAPSEAQAPVESASSETAAPGADTEATQQLNADAVIAAMASKPSRRARTKSEDAKPTRRSRAKAAPSAPAPDAPTEAAKPATPTQTKPPRAPLGPRIAAWMSTLKPKAKPPKPAPAKTDAPSTGADAKKEKRKATVKPIPSLRERAAKRAEALQEASRETIVDVPAVEVPVDVPAIEAFAVEALTSEPPAPPPLPPAVAPTPVAAARIAPAPIAPAPIAPTAPPPVIARKRATAAAPSFARTHSATRLSMPARWRHIATIACLSLLLVLQLVLAQRDALAANARWRPSVGALCAAFRCSLPAWHQPEAFTMLSRDVRPHPSAPGTLRIDASFRNDARWAQAWPHLVVSLSDVDGRVVGTRAFSAREYLGAAPTQDTLASGQTAAIQLDVVEPAPGIVAFSFDFR